MMKNLKFIPLIEDKINNDYIENVKVFDIFLQKKLLKKVIKKLQFKELKDIEIKIYGNLIIKFL